MFVSKNNKTSGFIKWATEKLFTLQMGTEQQKHKLIADELGVDAQTISEVFDKDANSIPVVYFYTLGNVKTLRKSMNIDAKYKDNDIVGIYGLTKEFSRRTKEHIKTYKKLKGSNLKLKWYSYIDPMYLYKAEADIRNCMNGLDIHFRYEKEKEMVIIPEKQILIVQTAYENIGKKYIGHVSELVLKIRELEDKIEKDHLLHAKEMAEEKLKIKEEMWEKFEDMIRNIKSK